VSPFGELDPEEYVHESLAQRSSGGLTTYVGQSLSRSDFAIERVIRGICMPNHSLGATVPFVAGIKVRMPVCPLLNSPAC
jgi:hypothetical protein